MIKTLIEQWKTNRLGCVMLLVGLGITMIVAYYLYQVDFSPFLAFISQPITEAPLWLVSFYVLIIWYLLWSNK
jgi:hypothetical protein